jgi:hypothetical protein
MAYWGGLVRSPICFIVNVSVKVPSLTYNDMRSEYIVHSIRAISHLPPTACTASMWRSRSTSDVGVQQHTLSPLYYFPV